jgi:hypothetical protein
MRGKCTTKYLAFNPEIERTLPAKLKVARVAQAFNFEVKKLLLTRVWRDIIHRLRHLGEL